MSMIEMTNAYFAGQSDGIEMAYTAAEEALVKAHVHGQIVHSVLGAIRALAPKPEGDPFEEAQA